MLLTPRARPGSPGRARVRAIVMGVAALLAAVLTAGVLAGCGTPSSPLAPSGSSSASQRVADDLAGRTFLSTAVSGRELVPGTVVRLSFGDDGSVGLSAGCNSMSGPAHWSGDRLSVTDWMTTEMGCDPDLMAQDAWLTSWIGDGVKAESAGDTLTLTGADVVLALVDRVVADPDRPLEGTLWRLDGIISGDGDSASISSVPQGIRATMHIRAGQLSYDDGLNHYTVGGSGAALTIDADTVRVPPDGVAGTTVGCASEGPCSVDMSVLDHDFHYEITAGRLTVTGMGPTAGRGLEFVAETGTASSSPSAERQTSASASASGTAAASPQAGGENPSTETNFAGVAVSAVFFDSEAEPEIRDAWGVDQQPNVSDTDGTHAFVVCDAAGEALDTLAFWLDEPVWGDPMEGTAPAPPHERWVKKILAPFPPEATVLKIVSGGKVLASKAISAHAPVVNFDRAPEVTDDVVVVSWRASDRDGDPLKTTLLYSGDGGQSWNALAVGLTASPVSLGIDGFAGGAKGVLQAVTTDGMRSARAVSEPFTVGNMAPRVRVEGLDGDPAALHTASGSQTVVFHAYADDREDGAISGDSLTWNSNLDGVLAAGEELYIRADQLSEGTHVITLSAVDSGGATGTAKLKIVIER